VKNTRQHLGNEKAHFCLKPSILLRLCLLLTVFLCLYLVFGFWVSNIVSLILALLGSSVASGLGSAIGDYLAKQAELRKVKPNIWFSLDKKAEYRRHGPFRSKKRANRFGVKW
jgi:uncharacterized protein YneF (UPF0154 family)